MEEIWKAEKAALQGAQHIKEELEKARMELETAQTCWRFSTMSELQYGRIPELEKQLAQLHMKAEKTRKHLLRNKVTEEEIAEVVSKWTGIFPFLKCWKANAKNYCKWKKHCINASLAKMKQLMLLPMQFAVHVLDLSDPNRPIGSFLFLGPTGVGKTEVMQSLGRIFI